MSISRTILLCCLTFLSTAAFSQLPRFSLATDINAIRSIRDEQKYWAIGQTITGHFHIARKEGLYTWFEYTTNGTFTNHLSADAKLPATNPQQINYDNKAKLKFKHISFGWKHYFKGNFESEESWNLYGFAGLGLMLGHVENVHSVDIDTVDYHVPVLAGTANFKRLTLDLGLGYERLLGGDVYFYLESKTLAPMTDYPSRYLLVNHNAPLTITMTLGLRILF